MKVYIVVRYYPYEGYDEPEACFADRGSAEGYAAKKSGRRSEYEVFELEVHSPERKDAA